VSSWRNRCVQPLVAGADQPRRTAAAFAIGTFLSFSPFFGLQIAAGMAIAFALRINRAAMFVGLCTNLPWVMVPWYTLTTILGARMLGLTLPADLGGRLGALVEVPVYRAEFWTRAAVTVLYLMPLWVVLVFGLPDLGRLEYVSAGEIVRRALAAASFALVALVIATGLRLSSLRPASNYDYPPPVR